MDMGPQVAWNQISINAKMACGARKPVGSKDKLQFNVLKGNITKIIITLNPQDYYNVELGRITKTFEWKVIKSVTDVFCEDLSETIYHICNT